MSVPAVTAPSSNGLVSHNGASHAVPSVAHFVDGKTLMPESGETIIAVTSPLDGSVIGRVQSADRALIDQVVQKAKAAAQVWGATPVKDRAQVFFRFKTLVEAHIDELAAIISRENGKTQEEAKAEVQRGVEVVEYAASLPNLLTGEMLEVSRGVDCHTRREPLGVTLGITPFNFPAMVPMWMFPLALGCGNSFILKPSEQVPFTALRLAELLSEAGLPDGAFSVMQGDRDTVGALLDHPDIMAAAFVGSTAVAKAVYLRGTTAGKRVLALGGAKNHLVVMPDAEPDLTAKNVVASAMGCAGQRCMAASVLIAVGDCGQILDAIKTEAQKLRPGCELGALISQPARERILGYVSRAQERGATLTLDGREPQVEGEPDGYWLGPTILDGITRDDEAVHDEIFGPVLSVLHVDTLEEALAIENTSPYGNAASIYTTDGGTARLFEMKAQAGMIGINIGVPVPREPFGFGGWNQSKFGAGDITGSDGLTFWTQFKKVTSKWSARHGSNWMS